jgi:NADH-quinone oxidoreductase subunit J
MYFEIQLINATFNILIFFTLTFGILVCTATELFFSIFALIGVYFGAVWIFALLKLEFLAFVILIVYLGAIAVFFIFIVMTIPPSMLKRYETLDSTGNDIINVIISTTAGLTSIYFVLNKFNWKMRLNTLSFINPETMYSNIEEIGFLLYTAYFPVFILSGFLLFIAVICIIRISKP